MTKNWMSFAVVAALALGVGCGDDDGDGTTCDLAEDGVCPPGCPTDPDCVGMDMGGGGNPFEPPGLPPASLGEGGVGGPTADTTSPADLDCLGTATAPTGGEETTFSLQIREFNSGMAFEGLDVCFFPDNEVSLSGCTGQMATTDGSGNVSVMAPEGGWYAYRVFANDLGGGSSSNIQDSIQVNEVVPSGDSAEGNSVSEGTLGLIPAVLGLSRADNTALVAGTVQDCAGEPLYGAVVRMYDGTTLLEETEETVTPKYRYFNGESFPSASNQWTHVDGLYAAANIPAAEGGSTITVEVWGEVDGEFQVIGCEEVPALPDAISIVNVGPLRADGPTCPGQ